MLPKGPEPGGLVIRDLELSRGGQTTSSHRLTTFRTDEVVGQVGARFGVRPETEGAPFGVRPETEGAPFANAEARFGNAGARFGVRPETEGQKRVAL